MPILTLQQVNAATLTPFSKEDKILIKNLYECQGYSTRQLITEFPDKGWTNNSIYGEVEKVRNSGGARILEQVGPAAGPKVVW